jgi:hypothetical protein
VRSFLRQTAKEIIMIAFFDGWGLSGRIGLAMMMLALFPAAAARAERLVTYRFEGVIDASSAELVSEGDRFVGAFTYDLDAIDDVPEDPEFANYYFSLPQSQPVGFSYDVGGISFTAESFVEIIIDNFVDPETGDFEESFVLAGVTEDAPAGLAQSGSIFLEGATPEVLDLGDFSSARFYGDLPSVCTFHHCTDESFHGSIEALVLVPEPASVCLCALSGFIVCVIRAGRIRTTSCFSFTCRPLRCRSHLHAQSRSWRSPHWRFQRGKSVADLSSFPPI